MTKRKYDAPLYLEMPFGEALERFAGTKPEEVAAGIAKSKKAKPPGEKLKAPPDGVTESKNVNKLARQRKREGS